MCQFSLIITSQNWRAFFQNPLSSLFPPPPLYPHLVISIYIPADHTQECHCHPALTHTTPPHTHTHTHTQWYPEKPVFQKVTQSNSLFHALKLAQSNSLTHALNRLWVKKKQTNKQTKNRFSWYPFCFIIGLYLYIFLKFVCLIINSRWCAFLLFRIKF